MLAFDLLVAAHITTGAVGLAAFWAPVIGRKGGEAHRRWGLVFNRTILATGVIAIAMSIVTLLAPVETHPRLAAENLMGRPFDAALIRAIFGWMMLYVATLTINLTWYGWCCIAHRQEHLRNRGPINIALQIAVILVSANVALEGWLVDLPLLWAFSIVGFATGATNLWFITTDRPGPDAWQKEHLKGLVGAGISVYTAFFAFGAVRLFPQLALNPLLWAVPLVTGLWIIIHHRRVIDRRRARLGFAVGTA